MCPVGTGSGGVTSLLISSSPFQTPISTKSFVTNPPWQEFLRSARQNIFLASDRIYETGLVSGTTVLKTFEIDDLARPTACFIFYMVRQDGADVQRAGFIIEHWDDDGTLPAAHAEMFAGDIGTTVGVVTFSFDYSSPNVRWKVTITGADTWIVDAQIVTL